MRPKVSAMPSSICCTEKDANTDPMIWVTTYDPGDAEIAGWHLSFSRPSRGRVQLPPKDRCDRTEPTC